MKKLVLSFSLLIGLFLSATAQESDSKYKVSLGPEYLYTFGDVAEFYSMGYGASLQGELKLTPKLSVTASGGYLTLSVSKLYKQVVEPWGAEPQNTIIYPAKAGLKYSLFKNIYAAAEAGAAISPNEVARATSFAYAGGLGTSFAVSSKSSLDLGLRYEAWSLNANDTYSFIGIRAAYVFGFGK